MPNEFPIIQGSKVKKAKYALDDLGIVKFVVSFIEIFIDIVVFPFTVLFFLIFFPMIYISFYLFHLVPFIFVKTKYSNKNIFAMEIVKGPELFWITKSRNAPDQDQEDIFKNYPAFLAKNKAKIEKSQLNMVALMTMDKKKEGKLDIKQVKTIIQEKIIYRIKDHSTVPIYPRFTQRIVTILFCDVWITDPSFNINDHVIENPMKFSSLTKFLEYVSHISSIPFLKEKPRWKLLFLPNFPDSLSTLIFICDPAFGDGVYLMDILSKNLSDKPEESISHFNFAAFDQNIEIVRSLFGGIFWFIRNLWGRGDNNKLENYWKKCISSKNNPKQRVDRTHSSKTSQKDPKIHERKLFMSAPISDTVWSLIKDVTKATYDEIALTIISSSLRDYLIQVYNIRNPHDVPISVAVSFQNQEYTPQKSVKRKKLKKFSKSQSNISDNNYVESSGDYHLPVSLFSNHHDNQSSHNDKDMFKMFPLSPQSMNLKQNLTKGATGISKNVESSIQDESGSIPDPSIYFPFCKAPDFRCRMTTLKFDLPVNTQGIIPSLWVTMRRILDSKLSTNHLSLYTFSNWILPVFGRNLSKLVGSKLLDVGIVDYKSLVGSKNPIVISGYPLTNLSFWGPIRKRFSIGYSVIVYNDVVNVNMSIDSCLNKPELLIDFFEKKIADLSDLLKLRRVKHQPRMDTLFVPLKEYSGVFEDEMGMPMELRKRRRSSYVVRKQSVAALASLIGGKKN